MSTVIAILIVIVILALFGKLYQIFKDKINFFIGGLDNGFSFGEILTLWNAAKICGIDNPNELYFSLKALTRCMTQINNKAAAGDEDSAKLQDIMSKLFAFRTKLQNESDEKKGIESTLELDTKQRLRIILPGKGVFVSEIVNNGRELIIDMPRQKNMIPVPADDWVGKTISVYLWRNKDAKYVFDTTVEKKCVFLGNLCLQLKHTSNLLRTQKRQSVRAKCKIHAGLYLIQNENKINYGAVETSPGLRCLLEDISESGALIRIGGKGVPNMKIKLQFNINNKLILMFGIVRSVEYNSEINQTRLHFECIHIEPQMRNDVLSYVYNMLPDEDKEVYDALSLTDSDEAEEEGASENQADQSEELKQSQTDQLEMLLRTEEPTSALNKFEENNQEEEPIIENPLEPPPDLDIEDFL